MRFARLISTLFTGPGDQPAFVADVSNRDNGLIYTANSWNAVGAALSEKNGLFAMADRRRRGASLNLIFVAGRHEYAARRPMLTAKHKKMRDNDD